MAFSNGLLEFLRFVNFGKFVPAKLDMRRVVRKAGHENVTRVG